jgi:Cu/Ag efflux protein CusF
MKRFLTAAACAALLASPALAGAPSTAPSPVPSQTTGTITRIDLPAATVTLDDGKTFTMQNNLALNTFRVGQRVTVSYMSQAGKLMASDVKPAVSGEAPQAPAAEEPDPNYR